MARRKGGPRKASGRAPRELAPGGNPGRAPRKILGETPAGFDVGPQVQFHGISKEGPNQGSNENSTGGFQEPLGLRTEGSRGSSGRLRESRWGPKEAPEDIFMGYLSEVGGFRKLGGPPRRSA